jgi:hypothetical protein
MRKDVQIRENNGKSWGKHPCKAKYVRFYRATDFKWAHVGFLKGSGGLVWHQTVPITSSEGNGEQEMLGKLELLWDTLLLFFSRWLSLLSSPTKGLKKWKGESIEEKQLQQQRNNTVWQVSRTRSPSISTLQRITRNNWFVLSLFHDVFRYNRMIIILSLPVVLRAFEVRPYEQKKKKKVFEQKEQIEAWKERRRKKTSVALRNHPRHCHHPNHPPIDENPPCLLHSHPNLLVFIIIIIIIIMNKRKRGLESRRFLSFHFNKKKKKKKRGKEPSATNSSNSSSSSSALRVGISAFLSPAGAPVVGLESVFPLVDEDISFSFLLLLLFNPIQGQDNAVQCNLMQDILSFNKQWSHLRTEKKERKRRKKTKNRSCVFLITIIIIKSWLKTHTQKWDHPLNYGNHEKKQLRSYDDVTITSQCA